MERLTYGYISIISHAYKQHNLYTTNHMDEEDLSDATSKGDDLVLSEQVINHLGTSDTRNT